MQLQIGVIGGSNSDERHLKAAYQVGTLLSRSGAVVICGGLTGVMESVAAGVEAAGGICIGILPGTSPSEGNSHLTVGLPTGIGYARNFLIIRAADCLIAIDGSNGTISEAAFALAEGKTVVSLDSFRLERGKDSEGDFIPASTPEEAVAIAIREGTRRRGGRGVTGSPATTG